MRVKSVIAKEGCRDLNMKSNLTKNSSLADYITTLERENHIEPEHIGRIIVSSLFDYNGAPEREMDISDVNPEYKIQVVQRVHENVRTFWVDLRFGTYRPEKKLNTDSTYPPGRDTLEGAIQYLRGADESLKFQGSGFFVAVTRAAQFASMIFHPPSDILLGRDRWRLYDLMRDACLFQASRISTDRTEQLDLAFDSYEWKP